MKLPAIAACVAIVCAFSPGCNPVSRHEALTFVFDGVPPLPAHAEPVDSTTGQAALQRHVGPRDHGPYAAKMCNACHVSAARNALVAPVDRLCFQCHTLSLDKKYIHGPLASGGCLACHDPHSSRYRYLLLSESDGFCLHCHDRRSIARNPVHADVGDTCTNCHDAHMSDKKYLLR